MRLDGKKEPSARKNPPTSSLSRSHRSPLVSAREAGGLRPDPTRRTRNGTGYEVMRLGDERREGMSVAPNLTVSFRLFLSPYAPQARAKAVGRRPPKGASPVCDASGVERQ